MKVVMALLMVLGVSCGGEKGRSVDDVDTNLVGDNNGGNNNGGNGVNVATMCTGVVQLQGSSYNIAGSGSSSDEAIENLRADCSSQTGSSCRPINTYRFLGLGQQHSMERRGNSIQWICSAAL